jgi:hypothetical protein
MLTNYFRRVKVSLQAYHHKNSALQRRNKNAIIFLLARYSNLRARKYSVVTVTVPVSMLILLLLVNLKLKK